MEQLPRDAENAEKLDFMAIHAGLWIASVRHVGNLPANPRLASQLIEM